MTIWKWLAAVNAVLLVSLVVLKLQKQSFTSASDPTVEVAPLVSIVTAPPKASVNEDFQSKLKPEQKVEYVLENFADWDLEVALRRIADDYGKLGPEAIKHFILSLPPGDIGINPMLAAVEYLSIDDVPDMLSWLSAHWEELGPSFAESTVGTIVSLKISDNPDLVMDSLIKIESLPEGEKLAMLQRCIGSDEERIDVLNSIAERTEDASLKMQITFLPSILKGHLEEAPSAIRTKLTQIEDPLERSRALSGLERTIPLTSNPAEAIEFFREMDLPDMEFWLVRTVAEWVRVKPNEALAWVGTMEAGSERDGVISASWRSIAAYDVASAREWIDTVQRPQLRELLRKQVETFDSK